MSWFVLIVVEAIVLTEILKKQLESEDFYLARLKKHCCFQANDLNLRRSDVETALQVLEGRGLIEKVKRDDFPSHVFVKPVLPQASEFLQKWGKELEHWASQCKTISQQIGEQK